MSRAGNFSSSEIYKLMSKGRGNWSIENTGAPFDSYIKDKIRERRLGRSISGETNARAANWGKFLEKRAFDLMPMGLRLTSDERFYHPDLPWSGMPDALSDIIVGDIKCPWTLNSFCDTVDAIIQRGIQGLKEDKPEHYWQLVSNSILTKRGVAQLWVYCPYQEELEEIREMANNYDGDQNKIAFINWADDQELPYLIKGEFYQNLNKLEFKVPEEDKEALTLRVKMATEILESQLKAA